MIKKSKKYYVVNDFINDYTLAIMDIYRLINGYPRSYWTLFRNLNSTPYVPIYPKDNNRVGDALVFRQRFTEDAGLLMMFADTDYLNGRCSLLELIVSFAIRLCDEWISDIDYSELIMMLLNNLGLSQYDDSHYYDFQVDSIVYNFVAGNITKNGMGGLFPLQRNEYDVDQQHSELWDQAMAWISENMVHVYTGV